MAQGGAEGFFPTPTPLLPGSPSRLPPTPAVLRAAGSGLPGAAVRGGLQLHAVQQLRPLLLPHAALHQRPPAHMNAAETPSGDVRLWRTETREADGVLSVKTQPQTHVSSLQRRRRPFMSEGLSLCVLTKLYRCI